MHELSPAEAAPTATTTTTKKPSTHLPRQPRTQKLLQPQLELLLRRGHSQEEQQAQGEQLQGRMVARLSFSAQLGASRCLRARTTTFTTSSEMATSTKSKDRETSLGSARFCLLCSRPRSTFNRSVFAAISGTSKGGIWMLACISYLRIPWNSEWECEVAETLRGFNFDFIYRHSHSFFFFFKFRMGTPLCISFYCSVSNFPLSKRKAISMHSNRTRNFATACDFLST